METELDGGRDVEGVFEIQRSVDINAPVEVVFEQFTSFEGFPRFIPNVQEVRPDRDNRLHWKAAGSSGQAIEWDAAVIEFVENQSVAWRSEPGSSVHQAGNLYFLRNESGSTRVIVKIVYRAPSAPPGSEPASLLGPSPRLRMEERLHMMREYIERYLATDCLGRLSQAVEGGIPESGGPSSGTPPRRPTIPAGDIEKTPPGDTYTKGQPYPEGEIG